MPKSKHPHKAKAKAKSKKGHVLPTPVITGTEGSPLLDPSTSTSTDPITNWYVTLLFIPILAGTILALFTNFEHSALSSMLVSKVLNHVKLVLFLRVLPFINSPGIRTCLL